MESILALVFIGGVIWLFVARTKEKEERRKRAKANIERAATEDGFQSALAFTSHQGETYVAVQEHPSVLRITSMARESSPTRRDISVNKILRAELRDDGATLHSIDVRDAAQSAAAAGIVFGGVGAIVGALAAPGTQAVKQVSLSLHLDDLTDPLLDVNLLDRATTRGAYDHMVAVEFGRKLVAAIELLMRRQHDAATSS